MESFPPELQKNRDEFYSVLLASPRRLRAMAGVYDLDVSMSLDDLAWHFGNHNDARFLEETVTSLKEAWGRRSRKVVRSRVGHC